jgi:hypothetical protein
MSISNMKIGAAQLRTLVRGLLAAGATVDEVLDVVMSAASEVRDDWQPLGDAASRVVSNVKGE